MEFGFDWRTIQFENVGLALSARAFDPMKILLEPDDVDCPADEPRAVLFEPVVLELSEL